MVKVSIIVPVYNVENYIRKNLNSLVNQTLKDIEIIVVDDGSTDNSANIIKEYTKKYENVKYYYKDNGGLSDARNFGMKYATGKYIGFVDADDYVDVDMYKIMYKKAKEDDSDLVECNFYWAYPKNKKISVGKRYNISKTVDTKNKKDIGIKYKSQREMIINARVMACNKIYKRELLEKTNIKFEKGLKYEDVEFFYKLVPHIDTASQVKDVLYYYVQRKNSIANTQAENNKDIFIALDNVINYYKENKIYDKFKDELEYTYTRLLLCSSLKRISKIKDRNIRKQLLNKTWINLNENFPLWKENKILNTQKNNKNRYMKTINRFTYRIYSRLFSI